MADQLEEHMNLTSDTQSQAIDRRETDMTDNENELADDEQLIAEKLVRPTINNNDNIDDAIKEEVFAEDEEEKYNHVGPNGHYKKQEPELHAQPGTKDHEIRAERVNTVVENHKDDVNVPSVLLHRLFDRESLVPKKVHNKDYKRLNEVDKDWKYNITLGDLEKREITHFDGTKETLWFPMEKYPDDYNPDPESPKSDKKDDGKKKKKLPPPRKVFVALKVKRVSAVDNIAETVMCILAYFIIFFCLFRSINKIYSVSDAFSYVVKCQTFNWIPTESDYKSYYKAKKLSKKENKPQLLTDWEPRWYPHLEFQNMIEEHTKEWELYPEEGFFRIQQFKDFGQEKEDKIPDDEFDCNQCKFIRAKLECEMTFAEELELQSFPFDCQDLSCVIHERTTGGVRCIFLPELRKKNFGSIDPRYSVIDEWDLETAVLEFGDADSGASRSKSSYAMIVLRLKMKRRWKVFFANIVFLMACISLLALTAFSLTEDDLGDRLNLLITLILTAVAFSYVVFDSLPNVPYLTYMDKYILSSYGFLVALMIISALMRSDWYDAETDRIVFWMSVAWLLLYNIGFGAYGYYLRKDETMKLTYSSDQIEKEVNLSRPGLRFDYTKRMRSGQDGRLLSFVGYTHASDHMNEEQKEKLKQKQTDLDKLYATQTTRHGYDPSEIPTSPELDALAKQ